MAIKLNLTSKLILDKEFTLINYGYDCDSVDEFLDKIISDYKRVEQNALLAKSEVENLKGSNESLKQRIRELEIENAKYKEVYELVQNNKNVTKDNLVLLNKISRYESWIYRQGVDPHTIK